MSGSGIRAGRAYIDLATKDGVSLGLRKVTVRLRAFQKTVNRIGRSMSAAGVLGAAGFTVAVRTMASFDDTMRSVRAVTSATEDQFRSMRIEARRLGAQTSFSATQVAGAMAELGRAGFNPREIVASTEGVLSLAKATGTDLPRAAEIAGAALRGFGLDAEQMPRVSDILTTAANTSAQTLEDLFEAFKPVAPIAAQAGEQIESTAALIGILANNGIKGSLAGNALARAYKNLATESGQADLRKLGVGAVDSAGNLRSMADIIADLSQATAGMASARRLSVFESLFGRGQAAALVLASSGGAVMQLQQQIQDSGGAAVRTAEEMEAGIGGAGRRILSAMESVSISIGDAIEGPLLGAARAIQIGLGYIDVFVQKNETVAKVLLAGTAVATVAGFTLLGLGAAAGVTAFAIGGLISTIGVVTTVAGAAVSPLALVTAGVVALGAGILHWTGLGGRAIEWLGQRFEGLLRTWRPVVKAMSESLSRGEIGAAAKVLWAKLKLEWHKGVLALQLAWVGMKTDFLVRAQEMWTGLQVGFRKGLLVLQEAWVNVVTFFRNVWDGLTGWLAKLWIDIEASANKAAVRVKSVGDDTINVDAEHKSIDERAAVAKTAVDQRIEQDRQKRAEEARADIEDLEAKSKDRIEELFAQLGETEKSIRENAGGDLTDLVEDLRRARDELDAAVREARGTAPTEGEGAGPAGESIAGRIQSIVGGFDTFTRSSGLSSQGTFNPRAAEAFAAQPLSKLVDLSSAIAKDTRRIADNSAEGLTFEG